MKFDDLRLSMTIDNTLAVKNYQELYKTLNTLAKRQRLFVIDDPIIDKIIRVAIYKAIKMTIA